MGAAAGRADIKQSFAVYFDHNVHAESLHLYCAYYAWLAKDWVVLVEQLATANPDVVELKRIGGREVYERMVADAKEHAAESSVGR